MKAKTVCGAVLASVTAALGLAFAGAPAAASPAEAGERLGETINRALRADGPFFTAEERAVIERKCGYAPGEWDGFEASMIGKVFYCENGRRLDDPEIRAVMAAAAPRIERRVKTVMARADVRAEIDRVAQEAETEALAKLAEKRGR